MVNTLIQSDKPRICFVAHLAYGAMAGGQSGHIGGVERQTSLMAKWFAGRGYRVSMITWDEGQEDGVEIDGVRVFKMCRNEVGIKGLRFFWPKWTSLVAAMKRADADIYYQNNAECVTGQVALWCRRHRRKFVYSVASNTECEPTLPRMRSFRERVLYRYGLLHADAVIVQTCSQKEMLRANFGVDSKVLPMPCPGPSEDECINYGQTRNGSPHVLWIGRICEVKRPDRLLDLAESCPDLDFDLVGPTDDSAYAGRVFQRARTIANVTLHGPVARGRIPEFYRKAGIMCCTSDYEGFPNTFLEAWSYGLPIVSTFDPDNLIAEKGLGQVANNVPELARGIQALLDSPKLWRSTSQAARQHYLQNYTVEKAMTRFEQVFKEVLQTQQED